MMLFSLLVPLLISFVIRAESCGYPGSPAHASVSFTTETIEPDTIATYTCDNGYELLGPSRRTCHANGTWTPLGIPFCVLNVGVGKAAMQSSTVGQGSAQKAVDGSTSTFYNPGTCTMTEVERSPWWYVNLLEPYLVQLVRIDFGTSCCSNHRPATIVVRVGNNRPDLGVNPICNKYTGFIEEGRPLFLPCARPMPGAFVSVHMESPPGNPLSICETFVYTDHALSIEQCPSFRDQPLGSTATYNGKCYIFYNNQPMTFDNGKRFCEIRGGSLVDETSPALQGFMSWELYRRHRNDPNGQYWLGAVRDSRNANNWKWINGKDVTISFWNLPGTNDNCSRFDGSKGWLWSDTNCNLNLNFICQHRPLSCGKPERPANSTILARTVDIGSIIEYRCADGNLLVGPNIRTCLPNGFFSEFSPKCKYLECGFPASVTNGNYRLVNDTRAYMSAVSYSCNEGYVLVGRATLTCDVDERWNGPPPRCEPILCPSPPLIANGVVALSSNVTVHGTIATYNCFTGLELIGEASIECNTAGYWDGQPPFCKDKRPITTSSTTTRATTTTTTTTTTTPAPPPPPFPVVVVSQPKPQPTRRVTQNSQGRPIYIPGNRDSPPPSVSVHTSSRPNRPQIALIPVATSTTPAPSRPYVTSQRRTTTTSTTSTSTSTTSRRPTTSAKSKPTLIRTQDNEVGDSLRASNKAATAKLNMGGIIALGVFGGFVFLAAVITIIVIIVRRVKNSRSSIDAQTISTFDSSGDQSGFYRNYQQAWENLRYTGHSASYKPNLARLETIDPQLHPHHGGSRNGGGRGTVTEGFRDSNEITLNADVAALYSRPDKRHNKRQEPDGQSHWVQSRSRKY